MPLQSCFWVVKVYESVACYYYEHIASARRDQICCFVEPNQLGFSFALTGEDPCLGLGANETTRNLSPEIGKQVSARGQHKYTPLYHNNHKKNRLRIVSRDFLRLQ